MPIRIRLQTPRGNHTISLADDAAVSDLLSTITDATSLPLFTLKWGFPPQPLDPSLYGLKTLLRETDLKLNGAQLIVIAEATGDPSEARQAEESSSQQPSKPLGLKRKEKNIEDTPEVPIPSRDGTLVLRVMPDDNSCMFRAFGTACLSASLDSMTELRSLVAQRIQLDKETYNEVVLQRPPDEYCQWIQYPDSWGGGIELSILSQEFDVEICAVSVNDQSISRFNEGRPNRVILVFSGIHYDTIAFVKRGSSTLDADQDIKLFPSSDDAYLEAAKQLCSQLHQRGYYTDTATFSIKCNQCGWKGKGEKEAVGHAQETGHGDFGEAS